ncbi:MAG: phosphoribosyltransferase [Phycisphaerae bacterium]|nr:phosphoribosyltransferase [Phycisphaerae bacterium]|tara:strand:- start:9100 stop:9735 length:636 start_codon:yes stop_codon:yes gene_type:complete
MSGSNRSVFTRRLLDDCGALITDGHFVYASGEHGPGWIAKDIINTVPSRPRDLGAMLAEAVAEAGIEADVVCGPAVGGVICAQYTALAMGIECIFAERHREDGRETFRLNRGYDVAVSGRRVLVVDDVINTGHSTGLVLDAVRAAGASICGVATWINRGNVGHRELGVDRFIFLDEIELPSIPAAECHLCRNGVPVNTDYAHGAEFVSSQK